jgi:hypothetical protein
MKPEQRATDSICVIFSTHSAMSGTGVQSALLGGKRSWHFPGFDLPEGSGPGAGLIQSPKGFACSFAVALNLF